MKVLHLIESLGVGGAETLLVNLLPELQSQGDEVTLAVMRGPFDLRPALESHGVRVVVLRARHRWNLIGAARELAALVRSGGHEVVHAHLYFPVVVAALSRRLGLHRAAQVVSFHNLAYAPGVNKAGVGLRWRKWLAAALYPRGFDAMLGVSAAVARHYEQALRLHGVQVLHNPVPRALAGRPWPVPADGPDGFLVVVPGRLVHEKGHADFLQALAVLRAQGRHLSVTLAGQGPLRGALEQQIGQLGLADCVAITGAMLHAQLLDVVEAASLVVVPSRFEGFGLTALEAMALGRPVVATTAGGLPEVIEHGVSGWLVPPQDPVALAQAIGRMMDDAGLRQRLGAAGRARAQERFSLPVLTAQLRETYRRVVLARQTDHRGH
jgi:glycosyltransferase involved in cell wall biosynthesis